MLEVADDGPGMSERDAARAFDRFHRGARDSVRGQGSAGEQGTVAAGSGLGLSIVAAIAAAHGGYARLRSAPGAGTIVHLWIPISFSERTGVAPQARPFLNRGQAGSQGRCAFRPRRFAPSRSPGAREGRLSRLLVPVVRVVAEAQSAGTRVEGQAQADREHGCRRGDESPAHTDRHQ